MSLYLLFGIVLLSFVVYALIPIPSPFSDVDSDARSTQDLLKEVRKIEIKTKDISNHLFSGEYHSAFKGRGMSFSEVREYQYGDDVRNIDWNVTARFNEPFVKVYEEERELTVMLLIDVSESSFFGTRKQLKNELITNFCGVISFSAINNNDKIGVIFFSEKIEKFIPPKKGKSHVLRIIRELLSFRPTASGTDIDQALRYFSNVMKKKCITFLISDFMDEGYEHSLKFTARRHDLVGVHVYDPWEKNLPTIGMVRARDAETGETAWLDTGSKNVRNKQYAHFRENEERAREVFRRAGSDLLSIQTDRPFINELMSFFKKRN